MFTQVADIKHSYFTVTESNQSSTWT